MVAFYWIYWTRGYWGQFMPLPSTGLAAPVYITATAACLSSIVTGQMGNVFACRSTRASIFKMGFFSNRLIWLGIAVETTLILAIDYLKPFQFVFGTAPLRLTDWLFLLTITPTLLLLEEGRKWLVRRRSRPAHGKWGKAKCDLSSSVAAG